LWSGLPRWSHTLAARLLSGSGPEFLALAFGACALEADASEFLQPLQLLRGEILPDFAGFGLLHRVGSLAFVLLIMINEIMSKSTIAINKIRKRKPGAGRKPVGPFVGVRLPPEMLAVVDEYAAEMSITRSKAIRDMFTHAITEWAKIKKRRKP
jgi:hypothetical protein